LYVVYVVVCCLCGCMWYVVYVVVCLCLI
jgi:hypothetical protein